MNVLDYMAMEICETKCANKRLTKALILVSTIGLYSLSSLYSLTKQLKKEKERRYELQKEMEELAKEFNEIQCEVVKDNETEINKYKKRLNEIYGAKAFTETPKGE